MGWSFEVHAAGHYSSEIEGGCLSVGQCISKCDLLDHQSPAELLTCAGSLASPWTSRIRNSGVAEQ